MELILKSNNKANIEKVIALAKRLHMTIEQKDRETENNNDRETLKKHILNFKAKNSSSFGDAKDWQSETRSDRDLPFP